MVPKLQEHVFQYKREQSRQLSSLGRKNLVFLQCIEYEGYVEVNIAIKYWYPVC